MVRRLCLLTIIGCCFQLNGYSQSVLQYHFKPGEQLRYHYKIASSVESTSRRGTRESETVFEADPVWDIHGVTTNGEATATLTVKNRKENYIVGNRKLNFLHLTPQTEISVNNLGNLLSAKIVVDDTERTLTKTIVDKVPGIHLASDFDVFRPYFQRIWYSLENFVMDTSGKPFTKPFDSTYKETYERDTTLFGRIGLYRVAGIASMQHKGQSVYTLADTSIGSEHFWHLHFVITAEFINLDSPHRGHNEYMRDNDLFFRKNDGLLQFWRYTMESHTGTAVNNSKMSLELLSSSGD